MGYIPSHIRTDSDWRVTPRRTRTNTGSLVVIGLAIGGVLALLAAIPLPL